MPLEVATYVSQLVPTNPANSESVRQGDDHIRLIKTTLKNTFPELAGPVGTNGNPGFIPVGGIILWSGTIANIPEGWALCNGTNGTPNLTSRFVVGAVSDADATYAPGATGGAASVTLTSTQIPAHTHSSGSLVTGSSGSHTHSDTFTVNTASLSGSFQIRRVDVSGNSIISASGIVSAALDSGTNVNRFQRSSEDSRADVVNINASHSHSLSGGIVSNGSHTHSISGSTGSIGGGGSHENRPPYYALAYIMKL